MRLRAWLVLGLATCGSADTARAQVIEAAPPHVVPLPPVFDMPTAERSLLPVGYQELFESRFDPPAAVPSSTPVEEGFPIDLAAAVHLAGGESLAVALAREQTREANARVQAAEALWLPSIRLGLNYNKHEGVIQDVVGNAFRTSRGAFFNGLGAGAVGASSPAYPGLAANFHLADALIQPLAARQTAAARYDATTAARNDALLDGALGYLDLLNRAQDLAVATEARGRAAQLAELTGHFARSGMGTAADADRARAELSLRDVDLTRCREAYDVARARLAQVLRLDPTLKLVPTEEFVAPLELTAAELPVAELVARGLSSRPELAEHRHLVCAAVERLRRERYAPLVPSVLVGTSFGGFGAGLGGNISGYGDRFDFDAVAYWELRNLGAGDRAARGVAQSQLNQARVRQLAMLDLVAREVVEAHAAVTSRRRQIEAARAAVAAAQDSYRRNVDRIHGGEGLPIETLQSLQAWATAEREYVRAVIDFNAAQFRLQRAMGYPVDSSTPPN